MTPAAERTMSGADWGLMLLLSVLWGGSFLFVKIAVAEIPPMPLVLGRVILAAAALWTILLAMRTPLPREPRLWAALAGMGVLNNLIPFSLIFWGQQHITAGLAAILNATTPIWTVLLAHLLTADEKLLPRKVAGVLLGLAGVAIMVGPSALAGLGTNLLAQLAMLGAALSYGFAGIFGRRFKGIPPMVTAAGQLTGTTVLLLPLLLQGSLTDLTMPSGRALTAFVGLALLSTALAYILYFRLLGRAGATNASQVTLLVPVSALLLGAAVLGEGVTPIQLVGMVAIVLGLLVIDGRTLRWLRQRWQEIAVG